MMHRLHCLFLNLLRRRAAQRASASRLLRGILSRVTIAVSALSAGSALALQGGVVESGKAQINSVSGATTINQSTDRAVINWQNFNIAPGESVQFNHATGADAATLNRVRGPGQTTIDGILKANGRVFIVNPNGVVFGQGAQVDVGALTATTLDIDTQVFMRGGNVPLTSTGNTAPGFVKVEAGAKITARQFVALLAENIVGNAGSITAGTDPQAIDRGIAMVAGAKAAVLHVGGFNIAVDQPTMESLALVANSGDLEIGQSQRDGSILLNAAGRNAVMRALLSNSGTITNKSTGAGSLTTLTSEGGLSHTEGSINASAGSVVLNGKEIAIEGNVKVGDETTATPVNIQIGSANTDHVSQSVGSRINATSSASAKVHVQAQQVLSLSGDIIAPNGEISLNSTILDTALLAPVAKKIVLSGVEVWAKLPLKTANKLEVYYGTDGNLYAENGQRLEGSAHLYDELGKDVGTVADMHAPDAKTIGTLFNGAPRVNPRDANAILKTGQHWRGRVYDHKQWDKVALKSDANQLLKFNKTGNNFIIADPANPAKNAPVQAGQEITFTLKNGSKANFTVMEVRTGMLLLKSNTQNSPLEVGKHLNQAVVMLPDGNTSEVLVSNIGNILPGGAQSQYIKYESDGKFALADARGQSWKLNATLLESKTTTNSLGTFLVSLLTNSKSELVYPIGMSQNPIIGVGARPTILQKGNTPSQQITLPSNVKLLHLGSQGTVFADPATGVIYTPKNSTITPQDAITTEKVKVIGGQTVRIMGEHVFDAPPDHKVVSILNAAGKSREIIIKDDKFGSHVEQLNQDGTYKNIGTLKNIRVLGKLASRHVIADATNTVLNPETFAQTQQKIVSVPASNNQQQEIIVDEHNVLQTQDHSGMLVPTDKKYMKVLGRDGGVQGIIVDAQNSIQQIDSEAGALSSNPALSKFKALPALGGKADSAIVIDRTTGAIQKRDSSGGYVQDERFRNLHGAEVQDNSGATSAVVLNQNGEIQTHNNNDTYTPDASHSGKKFSMASRSMGLNKTVSVLTDAQGTIYLPDARGTLVQTDSRLAQIPGDAPGKPVSIAVDKHNHPLASNNRPNEDQTLVTVNGKQRLVESKTGYRVDPNTGKANSLTPSAEISANKTAVATLAQQDQTHHLVTDAFDAAIRKAQNEHNDVLVKALTDAKTKETAKSVDQAKTLISQMEKDAKPAQFVSKLIELSTKLMKTGSSGEQVEITPGLGNRLSRIASTQGIDGVAKALEEQKKIQTLVNEQKDLGTKERMNGSIYETVKAAQQAVHNEVTAKQAAMANNGRVEGVPNNTGQIVPVVIDKDHMIWAADGKGNYNKTDFTLAKVIGGPKQQETFVVDRDNHIRELNQSGTFVPTTNSNLKELTVVPAPNGKDVGTGVVLDKKGTIQKRELDEFVSDPARTDKMVRIEGAKTSKSVWVNRLEQPLDTQGRPKMDQVVIHDTTGNHIIDALTGNRVDPVTGKADPRTTVADQRNNKTAAAPLLKRIRQRAEVDAALDDAIKKAKNRNDLDLASAIENTRDSVSTLEDVKEQVSNANAQAELWKHVRTVGSLQQQAESTPGLSHRLENIAHLAEKHKTDPIEAANKAFPEQKKIQELVNRETDPGIHRRMGASPYDSVKEAQVALTAEKAAQTLAQTAKGSHVVGVPNQKGQIVPLVLNQNQMILQPNSKGGGVTVTGHRVAQLPGASDEVSHRVIVDQDNNLLDTTTRQPTGRKLVNVSQGGKPQAVVVDKNGNVLDITTWGPTDRKVVRELGQDGKLHDVIVSRIDKVPPPADRAKPTLPVIDKVPPPADRAKPTLPAQEHRSAAQLTPRNAEPPEVSSPQHQLDPLTQVQHDVTAASSFVNAEHMVVDHNGLVVALPHVHTASGGAVYRRADGTLTTDVHGGPLRKGEVLRDDDGNELDERGQPLRK